jgi:GNAT superfamily N-acetyltransferase
MAAFAIRPARVADVPAAVTTLGNAFAPDALMAYFFAGSPRGAPATSMEFFSILLRTRLALGMPALVLERGPEILGVAMGYDTALPPWPAAFNEEWEALERAVPGLAARLVAYDGIADAHKPLEAHYYLGVLGVHSSIRGQGAGKALLEAFCAASAADPRSHGVYLETASPDSLEFYLRNGFELRGEGMLDATRLCCVFRRHR